MHTRGVTLRVLTTSVIMVSPWPKILRLHIQEDIWERDIRVPLQLAVALSTALTSYAMHHHCDYLQSLMDVTYSVKPQKVPSHLRHSSCKLESKMILRNVVATYVRLVRNLHYLDKSWSYLPCECKMTFLYLVEDYLLYVIQFNSVKDKFCLKYKR